MKRKITTKIFLSLLLIFIPVFPSNGQDGGPQDQGPTDIHKVEPLGQNQEILIIYVQANDYRILPSELSNLNATEDQEVLDFEKWYDETSWGACTFDVTKQRDSGGNWYILPEGILNYSRPAGIRSMEYRDSTQASNSNPTPPASVTATAGTPGTGDPASQFTNDNKGDYYYGVSSFNNGVESKLTRISSAVTVDAGEIITLTINRAVDDVDYYIVYRTGKNQTDTLSNYRRIDYVDVTGTSETYIDTGKRLDYLSDHFKLLTAAMEAANADVSDFEDYNAIITLIFSPFLRGQAAGPYTFDINGTQFTIQTINQSSSTGFGRFCHEIGHWVGLPDQYDPITAGGRGYWTTMDGANDRQYCTWEKEYKLNWIDNTQNVKYLERPPAGNPDLNETLKVLPTELEENAADTYTAIKIKSSDTVHYYVEGRDHFTGNASDTTANKIVVLMEAVNVWPLGIYPKRTLNEQKVLSAGDPTYSPDPNIEITYTGQNLGAPESYNVNVIVKAEEQPDPKITPWNAPPWETIDIWVDSEREGGGWDDPNTAIPKPGNGEAAWVNHINRVYARITNVGAAEATNVRVLFRVNTPGGMGGAGEYVDLTTPAPVDIPAGGWRNVYAEWTPDVGTHTCLQVEIEHLPGEADIFNNFAQENFTHFYTGSGSPWEEVTIPIKVVNPFEEPKRVWLEIFGLKEGWKARFENKSVSLEPLGKKIVNVTITPPHDADRCTKVKLDIQGYIQIDDFIQPYGGINPIIHLADPIKFLRFKVVEIPQEDPQKGKLFRAIGITQPKIVNKEIAIIMIGPDDRHEILFLHTNDNGQFNGTFSATKFGKWRAQAYYAGDDCNAPTESDSIEFEVDEDGLPYFRRWLSLHFGPAFPRGNLADFCFTGFSVFGDIEYQIKPKLSLYIIGGYNHFPSKNNKDQNIWNFNLNLRYEIISSFPWSFFINAGPGYYRFSGSTSELGANIGAGINYSLSLNCALGLGVNWHRINDDLNSEFIVSHAGFLLRF